MKVPRYCQVLHQQDFQSEIGYLYVKILLGLSEEVTIDQCYSHWLSFDFSEKKKKEKEFHFTENDVKYCAIWARLKEFFSDPANKQRQLAVKLRNLIQMYGLEHCLPVLFDVFSD